MRDLLTLQGLVRHSGAGNRVVATRDYTLPLGGFETGSPFGRDASTFRGRNVVLNVRDMAKAAAALIELDGLARRVLMCPPSWSDEKIVTAAIDIEADALVGDEDLESPAYPFAVTLFVAVPLISASATYEASFETEWVLPTSGTSGRPKLVVHTLRTLAGAIAPVPPQQWATFYDIRRYGGLQIFLRALAGEGSLQVSGADESIEDFLERITNAGVTHISGTPTHWRMVLMSGKGRRIDPDYVRLSGEIADDAVLQGLATLYPRAHIEHAYASTEAGVVFAVDDGLAGFPASFFERRGPIELKIVEGALHVRSPYSALRMVGADAPPLVDKDGYLDTGDMIELRGNRYLFAGRRGGVINVGGAKAHPEEIEAVLNRHEAVSASRVYARKNGITGELVVADVVLKDDALRDDLQEKIIAFCQSRLTAYMVPVRLRFVSSLPISDVGKLIR